MRLWPGSCIVHETFSQRKLVQLSHEHPDAKIVAHPECQPQILDLAHYIGSTNALLNYVVNDNGQKFIVVTESGILHEMQKRVPHKTLIAAPPNNDSCNCNECPFMRLNTPEKVYLALRDLEPRLEMSEELRRAAQKPLDRMLELS
jgi:quinolinate synthase